MNENKIGRGERHRKKKMKNEKMRTKKKKKKNREGFFFKRKGNVKRKMEERVRDEEEPNGHKT